MRCGWMPHVMSARAQLWGVALSNADHTSPSRMKQGSCFHHSLLLCVSRWVIWTRKSTPTP
eukprot:2933959-Alexandrium_andersonii.AAC.1